MARTPLPELDAQAAAASLDGIASSLSDISKECTAHLSTLQSSFVVRMVPLLCYLVVSSLMCTQSQERREKMAVETSQCQEAILAAARREAELRTTAADESYAIRTKNALMRLPREEEEQEEQEEQEQAGSGTEGAESEGEDRAEGGDGGEGEGGGGESEGEVEGRGECETSQPSSPSLGADGE